VAGVARCECGFDAWEVDPKCQWTRRHAIHHQRWCGGVRVRGDDTEAAFEKAALVYKLECGLDFSPFGSFGWQGSQRVRVIDGRLVAFALVVAADKPCLEHLWTCAAKRKLGVATELVRELVCELGSPLLVYHVVSDAGQAWCVAAEHAGLVVLP
jgi:hypothetical protein